MYRVQFKYLCYCFFAFFIFSLSSCSVFFTNKMFETPDGYTYAILDDSLPAYVLQAGDRFEMNVYSNAGDKLIDPLLVSGDYGSSQASVIPLVYEIDINGNVNLPKIGEVHLAGMMENASAFYLQSLYEASYIKPYVYFKVINKRVTVFRANANADVILLENSNMSIIEAIGKAGGLTAIGRSSKVKVIRAVSNDSTQVSLLDLSTIDGMQQAGKKVQPNDIIYIEPAVNTDFIKEITPIITVITSLVVIYVYFVTLNKS